MPRQRAVPTASLIHGWLNGRGASRAPVARALHRHGDLVRVARPDVVQGQAQRRGNEPTDLQPPGVRIDVRDVVVREQVVQADRSDVVAERFQRHPVVASGELDLLDAEVGHPA